ncbi:hypothetical protein AMTR_s00028p00175280 [Amborella trichopoda]|uniref:Uncharacterized protein n=1 Tax=Amborella trichopoda TaxID=13333 RepID=W1PSD2_AMBTC|nr:hypothetical protein AMTR_s00028p00175280 [Amborella trichopoda]
MATGATTDEQMMNTLGSNGDESSLETGMPERDVSRVLISAALMEISEPTMTPCSGSQERQHPLCSGEKG